MLLSLLLLVNITVILDAVCFWGVSRISSPKHAAALVTGFNLLIGGGEVRGEGRGEEGR